MNNEDLIKKMVETVWNKRQVQDVGDFFHQNIILHSPHGELKGQESIKKYIQELLTGFPDVEYKILDIFSSENKVVIRWQGKGTHKGVFLGNEPTNKKITYEGMTIHHIENNKIKEYWVNADLYGLLRQLGVLHHPVH